MKISVLTPSFNSVNYIGRAIQSVLNQDYFNWEHIIIDGGSTDKTIDLLKQYKHLNWISEPDRGQSHAMNKAFKRSSGDIIVYLNADDKFEKNIFGEIIQQFSSNNCDIVVGNLIKVYPDGRRLIDKPKLNLYKILNYWPCRFPLNSLSYFYKRHVQESVGLFPENNNYSMDYWFLLRVLSKYNPKYIDRSLGFFYYMDNKSSDIQRARFYLKQVQRQFLIRNPYTAIKYFLKNIS